MSDAIVISADETEELEAEAKKVQPHRSASMLMADVMPSYESLREKGLPHATAMRQALDVIGNSAGL